MSDLIDRQTAIDALCTVCGNDCDKSKFVYNAPQDEQVIVCPEHYALSTLPSAQTEIIHCCDCVYYDPEHIEKNGVRYEYKDMPKDAFDSLGDGMVNSEYGINVDGKCCRDYNVGYSEDKRVFVSEQNYCGRARRRQDE